VQAYASSKAKLILTHEKIEMILKFAQRNGLMVFVISDHPIEGNQVRQKEILNLALTKNSTSLVGVGL